MSKIHPFYLLIVALSYIAVLADISFFANWNILGGSPHLIPTIAIFFLIIGRANAGLVWIIAGSTFTDLIFSYRFGLTAITLLLGFGLCFMFLRHILNTPPWWTITGLGLFLVFTSQFPLAIISKGWTALPLDLLAASFILIPCSIITSNKMFLSRAGLRVTDL